MRAVLILILILMSCENHGIFYDKEFYERISSISIPQNAKILESIDNGEFVTATTFSLDSTELKIFAQSFGFKHWEDHNSLRLFSNSYLKKDKPDLENKNDYLYKSGNKGKNGWLYIIDLRKGLLWAEIQYPDAGGT